MASPLLKEVKQKVDKLEDEVKANYVSLRDKMDANHLELRTMLEPIKESHWKSQGKLAGLAIATTFFVTLIFQVALAFIQ